MQENYRGTSHTFTVEFTVGYEILEEIMAAAVMEDGAIDYWAQINYKTPVFYEYREKYPYDDPGAILAKMLWDDRLVELRDTEADRNLWLSKEAILTAYVTYANMGYEYDDADSVVQMSLFGKILYG